MRARAMIVLGCLGLVACARAAMPPASPPGAHPKSEEPASAPPGEMQQAPLQDAAGAEAECAPAPRSTTSVGPMREGPYARPPSSVDALDRDAWQLLDDLSVAEGVALSGQAGCERACRALRSMMRSADRLCAMAEDDAEKRVCDEAQRRVRWAKDTVRSNCRRCEDGPNLGTD